MIAQLSNNTVVIVESHKLGSVQEIKNKKIHMFCLNNVVYSGDGLMMSDGAQAAKVASQPLTDQLCIVTTDKLVIFYEFKGQMGTYDFQEDKSFPPYSLSNTPLQLCWSNDCLYIATKKNYQIINREDGVPRQTLSLLNQNAPQMCLSKSKCLILNENNHGFFFDKQTGLKRAIEFKFDKHCSPSQLAERGQIV